MGLREEVPVTTNPCSIRSFDEPEPFSRGRSRLPGAGATTTPSAGELLGPETYGD